MRTAKEKSAAEKIMEVIILSQEFKKDDKIGKIGEIAARKLLNQFGYQDSVIADVSKDPVYQSIDVDLVVSRGTKAPKMVEAKARTKDWHDIGLELVTNTTNNTPGWAYNTRSHIITQFAIDTLTLHVIDAPKMQQWLSRVDVSRRKIKRAKNYNNGIYYSDSIIFPVPLDEARKAGWQTHTYHYNQHTQRYDLIYQHS